MEQEIPEFPISRKKGNLERWTEIFETNFRKISVPFDFEPEFLEILVEWNAPRFWSVWNKVRKGKIEDNIYCFNYFNFTFDGFTNTICSYLGPSRAP